MSIVLFARKTKTLTPPEAWQAHRNREPVLVDVRQSAEWRSGVLPGALRIPLHEAASVKGGMLAWSAAGLPTSPPTRKDEEPTSAHADPRLPSHR
jgi:rhodanese-related sulfurtransferase